MLALLLLALASSPAPSAPLPLAHELVESSGLAQEAFAAWLGDLRAQYESQRQHLDPVPPDRFWEQVVVTFDLDAQRTRLDAAVAATLGSDEIYASLAWLRDPLVASLPERRERVRAHVQGARRGWEDAAARLAADVVEGRATGPSQPARPALSDLHADPDVEAFHSLMDVLGIGAPDVLEARWLRAAREAFPEVDDTTWDSPRARQEVTDAVRGVEHAVSRTWTAAEARELLSALASDDAASHRARLARLEPVLASVGDRFIADFEAHFASRFSLHALDRATALRR